MRGEWDLVFKSDESKGIGCAGSGSWCLDRMRARALGATAAGGMRRNPPVPTPKWRRPRRRAEARAGARAWGLPKGREPNPPKPEIQADFPLRWSAVLENWRVERAGPLQISSSEHLRTGKTRFRTGGLRKITRTHRPKANTNPLYIELELVEASGVA